MKLLIDNLDGSGRRIAPNLWIERKPRLARKLNRATEFKFGLVVAVGIR